MFCTFKTFSKIMVFLTIYLTDNFSLSFQRVGIKMHPCSSPISVTVTCPWLVFQSPSESQLWGGERSVVTAHWFPSIRSHRDLESHSCVSRDIGTCLPSSLAKESSSVQWEMLFQWNRQRALEPDPWHPGFPMGTHMPALRHTDNICLLRYFYKVNPVHWSQLHTCSFLWVFLIPVCLAQSITSSPYCTLF